MVRGGSQCEAKAPSLTTTLTHRYNVFFFYDEDSEKVPWLLWAIAYTTPMIVVAFLLLRAAMVSAQSDGGASAIALSWPCFVFCSW